MAIRAIRSELLIRNRPIFFMTFPPLGFGRVAAPILRPRLQPPSLAAIVLLAMFRRLAPFANGPRLNST
jgi:hypothetical protein